MRSNILDRVHAFARKRKLTKWTVCALPVGEAISWQAVMYAHSDHRIAGSQRQDITLNLHETARTSTPRGTTPHATGNLLLTIVAIRRDRPAWRSALASPCASGRPGTPAGPYENSGEW